jgi:hypothetical protein
VDVSSDSDSDSPPPIDFDLADWVGQGLIWSDGLPKHVKRARNASRRVPPAAYAAAAIPKSNLTVEELLQEELPAFSAEPSDSAKFSHEPVTASPLYDATWRDTIFTATPFTRTLRTFFNNAWLSGAASIKFPHLSALYPLWIESLLFEIQLYIKKRTV